MLSSTFLLFSHHLVCVCIASARRFLFAPSFFISAGSRSIYLSFFHSASHSLLSTMYTFCMLHFRSLFAISHYRYPTPRTERQLYLLSAIVDILQRFHAQSCRPNRGRFSFCIFHFLFPSSPTLFLLKGNAYPCSYGPLFVCARDEMVWLISPGAYARYSTQPSVWLRRDK